MYHKLYHNLEHINICIRLYGYMIYKNSYIKWIIAHNLFWCCDCLNSYCEYIIITIVYITFFINFLWFIPPLVCVCVYLFETNKFTFFFEYIIFNWIPHNLTIPNYQKVMQTRVWGWIWSVTLSFQETEALTFSTFKPLFISFSKIK